MFRQQLKRPTHRSMKQLMLFGSSEHRTGRAIVLISLQVEVLVRLFLVIPVTSCEAERSFSSMKQLTDMAAEQYDTRETER